MRALITTGGAAAALGLMLAVTAVTADSALARNHGYQALHHPKTFSIQRYPGDQAVEGGTVRVHGPDKGPYIERCYWTAEGSFFGLPVGLTQHCYRHTLENTPAPQ